MNDSADQSIPNSGYKRIRSWPAVLLMLGMLVVRLLPVLIGSESEQLMLASVFVPMLFGLLIVVWWVTFSRAKLIERFLGLMGFGLAIAIAWIGSDQTMRGPAFIVMGGPLGAAGFGAVAVVCSRLLTVKRTFFAIAAAVVGFGVLILFRSDGMWGDGHLGLSWRWEKSAEEILVDSQSSEAILDSGKYSDEQFEQWLAKPEWPQFRGPESIGIQTGLRFSGNWSTKPELVWKVPVGPGWSSFAVAGNLLFTQEQLGDNETVSCFAADTGENVWRQQIEQRFFDPLGGPGPRATPTLANGKLFAQSATGIVQCLDAKTGELVWSKDIKEIADREPPYWGFSSSPLVVEGNVIVYAGGEDGKGVLAFDADDGELQWTSKAGNHSYSSPQLTTLHDRKCIMMLTNDGLNVIDPDSGQQLLDYAWLHQEYRAIQLQVIDGNSVLLPTQSLGTRRIRVDLSEEGKFVAEEEWTSRQLKPDFNDFVVFENSGYGFDGQIFVSVDLSTGKRNWKGGRYGKGQVLLLRESELLLVTSEKGELILLKATPEAHQELSKFQALNARTWNHPVVIGDRLFVRNSEEAACFVLPTIE